MNEYKIIGKPFSGLDKAHKTIAMQKPYFTEIPNIDKMFVGTINLNIFPNLIKPLQFDYFVDPIDWGFGFLESFGFSKIKVEYSSQKFDGYLYFPSESPHFKNKYFFDYLEIMCEYIPDFKSSLEFSIYINKSKIDVYERI